jgi:5-hmdU DNA kinase-like protein
VPRTAGSPAPIRRCPPRPRAAVYRAYWHLAAERQRIFEARLSDAQDPWSTDPILRRYRFCNAFRASDRVSQYLIRDVVYSPSGFTPTDRILRTILFRLFSRPQTWEMIEERCGPLRAESFDPETIGAVLDKAKAAGQTLYTSAFILCANRAYGYRRKHRNHLALLNAMLADRLPEQLLEAPSLESLYEQLRAYPLIGPFMAYQLAIDLNYGPDFDFSEDDFTVPGPGAIRGLAKVFRDLGDFSPSQAIHWLRERQAVVNEELGISPPTLFGRQLHAIDCQNLLCELDKYARVKFPELRSDRTRIKQVFKPAGSLPEPFYPPRWGIRLPSSGQAPAAPQVQPGSRLAA